MDYFNLISDLVLIILLVLQWRQGTQTDKKIKDLERRLSELEGEKTLNND